MVQIDLQTRRCTDLVDITPQVAAAVKELGIGDGAALVYVPHTTAAVTVNEGADPDVVRDLTAILERLVPWEGGYRHAEGNSAAHAKSSLVGCAQLVPVQGGELVLGTWQKIWFCDFDGPRRRRVLVGRP